MLTTSSLNAMLDSQFPAGAGNVMLSAHTDFSATGANLTGAKTAANYSAASARSKALSAAVSIAIGAGITVKWIGLWDAAGTTFKGMMPNGGTDFPFQLDVVTNNRVYVEGSGYVNGDKITFHNGTPPTGLTEGVTYFVVGATAADPDYFQVSATSGGAAIDITGQAAKSCVVSKIIEEVFGAAGTLQSNSLTINL